MTATLIRGFSRAQQCVAGGSCGDARRERQPLRLCHGWPWMLCKIHGRFFLCLRWFLKTGRNPKYNMPKCVFCVDSLFFGRLLCLENHHLKYLLGILIGEIGHIRSWHGTGQPVADSWDAMAVEHRCCKLLFLNFKFGDIHALYGGNPPTGWCEENIRLAIQSNLWLIFGPGLISSVPLVYHHFRWPVLKLPNRSNMIDQRCEQSINT